MSMIELPDDELLDDSVFEDDPDPEDVFELAGLECGQDDEGYCIFAGSHHCEIVCPYQYVDDETD